jgi:hypothetical protein
MPPHEKMQTSNLTGMLAEIVKADRLEPLVVLRWGSPPRSPRSPGAPEFPNKETSNVELERDIRV